MLIDTVRIVSRTKKYYSQLLGVDPEELDRPGIRAFCSEQRDVCQKGYPRAFSLYCWLSGKTVIVSYSKSIQTSIQGLLDAFKDHWESAGFGDAMATLHPSLQHGRKFIFNEVPYEIDTSPAVQLHRENYSAYLAFFHEQHPQSEDTDWLEPYFSSLVEKGYVFGVFKDDILVSATDAPDMPFMVDKVAEIGINTLHRYRGKGHAQAVVAALINHLLKKGVVPMWSCAASNDASRALALSVGFKEMAETLYR